MYGVGHVWELLIILVLALVFIGPGKLPQVGGALAKTIREFRKHSTAAEDELKSEPQPAAAPPPQVQAPTQPVTTVQSAAPPQPAAQAPAAPPPHEGQQPTR